MSRPVSSVGKSVEITLKISEDVLGKLTGKKAVKATGEKPKKLTTGKPKKGPADKSKTVLAADKPKKIPVVDKSKKIPVADKSKKVLAADKPKKIPVADQSKKVLAADKPKKIPVADKPNKIPAVDKPNKIPAVDKPKKVPAQKPKQSATKTCPSSASTSHAGPAHKNDVHNDNLGDFSADPFASGRIIKHPTATRAADRENIRREYEYFSYAFKLHDRVREDGGKPLRPDFEKLADEAKEDGCINWSALPPLRKHQKKFKDYSDAADQVAKFLQKISTDGEKDEQIEARRLMKEATIKMSKLEGNPKRQKLNDEHTSIWEPPEYKEMKEEPVKFKVESGSGAFKAESGTGAFKVENGAGLFQVESGTGAFKVEGNNYYGPSGWNYW